MPTLRDLVAVTESHSVTLLAPADVRELSSRSVKRVVIVQDIVGLQTVPERSLIIVPSGLFSRQDSTGLDVLIRRVAERGALGVLVQGLVQPRPRIDRLTARFGVAVLGCPESADLGDLVTTLNQGISGGPADTLMRVSLALDHIQHWSLGADNNPAALVEAVALILGETLRYSAHLEHGTPVVVNGLALAYIGTGEDSTPTAEVRITMPALVNAIATKLAHEQEEENALVEERSRALTALIVADSSSIDHYAAAARNLKINVDGFHLTLAVQSATLDPVLRDLEFRRVQAAIERVFEGRVELHPTRVESSFGAVLASTTGEELDVVEVQASLQFALAEVDQAGLYWGLGTVLVGPAGIRASTSEARSASNAAMAEGITNRIVLFDATGIQRLISEVRASVTAGRVSREILEPLDGLKNRRALIETLNVWIEERGSHKTAAARLFLHPNAVAYRITRLSETLGIDLADADTRFALQIACRVALAK